jgi:DNA-binding NtrC family response regulator
MSYSYAEGIRQMEPGAFEFIIVGQGSRFFEGRCVVERAIKINRRLPVVVAARQLEMECYLEAMQLGAIDYVAEPSVRAEIARVLHTHLRHHQS